MLHQWRTSSLCRQYGPLLTCDKFTLAALIAACAARQAGAQSVDITLPEKAVWYEALGGAAFTGKAGKPLTTAVHMDAIPVFYRGGHIVPRR